MLEPPSEPIFYTAWALLGGSLVACVVMFGYLGDKTRDLGQAAARGVSLMAAAVVTALLWAVPSTVTLPGEHNSGEGRVTCLLDPVSFAAIDRSDWGRIYPATVDRRTVVEISHECATWSRWQVGVGATVWVLALGLSCRAMRSRNEETART